MQNEKNVNRIFAGISFIVSLFIYLKTIAPTTSFWDCGEFITCSYILGIPHPPGAPFYLLLGRIFTMIPFAADIGLRVNVISALTSALTVMLTYLIIVRLIKQWRGQPKNFEDMFIIVASGVLGALTYAFTDTFWFNAVEAEVYAISMFFTSFIVWLMLVWMEKADNVGSERYLLLIAYLVGLAIGVHLLMILVLPAIFLIVYYKYLDNTNQKATIKNLLIYGVIVAAGFGIIYPGVVQWIPNIAGSVGIWMVVLLIFMLVFATMYTYQNKKKITTLALMAVLLVITGYSTYSMIYIRSNLNPAIDENDPETMENMVKYLNREQYGRWSTFPRRYPGLPHEYMFKQQYPNRDYATFNLGKQLDFMWNYQIKKMYLRYFGWQFIGKGTTIGEDGYIKETFSGRGLLGLPFLIGLIGMVHHFYRHRRHAFTVLGIFILTGIAIIIYLNQEDPQPRERDYVYVGSFFAFSIWIGMGLTALLEWIKDSFRKESLKKPMYFVVTAALFIMAPINLLATNYKDHDRTGNYVAYDYSYNILQSCEPDAILFTNGDNDTFPLWFLQYVYNIRTDVRIVNLSLLNTPWYIKQLKYEEPKVAISYNERQIEELEVQRWETRTLGIPVPAKTRQKYLQEFKDESKEIEIPEKLSVQVEPTYLDQAIRVQDLMILNIIFANNWQRPVYFAVTVSDNNKVSLNKYLRMDGLTFKLVPYENPEIKQDILEQRLFEAFKFRNLNNPDVYYNRNILGLLQNYRAAFLRLADTYRIESEHEKMASILDRMEEVLPEDLIPFPDYRLSLRVGQMYEMAGRPDEFRKRLEGIVEQDPENPMATANLVSLLSRTGESEKAIGILEEWLERHPEDEQAKQRLQQERLRLEAKTQSAASDTDTVKTKESQSN